VRRQIRRARPGLRVELTGPVGESNIYALQPRGTILLLAETSQGLFHQLGAALATGNSVIVGRSPGLQGSLEALPPSVASRMSWTPEWTTANSFDAVLVEGDAARIKVVSREIARRRGRLIPVHAEQASADPYALEWLLKEVSVSVNTTASGGNASLMTIG